MSEESLNCLRCQTQLTFLGEKNFHEGSTEWGFYLGDVGELFTARTKVELYACEACGHLEFFLPD